MPMKTTQTAAMSTHTESSGDSPNGSDFGFTDNEDDDDDEEYGVNDGENVDYDDDEYYDDEDEYEFSGSGDGAGRLDLGLKPEPGSFVRLADLLKVSSQNEGSGLEMVRRRPKRSVFLHSGVRICPQETFNEVLASHQAYYLLRVCQEAVWEAFRIFFDRIPGTTEYQKWVHTCQHESLCISDLAQNFSSSEEHMSIITRRLNRMKERRPPSRRGTVTPAPQTPEATGAEVQTVSMSSITTIPPPIISASPESELPNLVPEGPVEQMLEFSIDLVDPGYRELLDDPDSPQYIDLAHHLQDQMQHVFVKLPGFKAIYVLGIR
ncbi:hypothetical protein JOQ06_004295 [Pogonophryne albipinna]|uniref:SEA domain-containing protein n=1 Tax=Pogonophryne albipinna TaxID=1090488 RepID=A0AAD6AN80_9TELE|nr:hypothetical protein JOQ06_004295 [Pogonophryne albipinna]